MLHFARSNWFVLGLLVVIALAAAFPTSAPAIAPLFSSRATGIAIFVIFFVNGIILPTETILGGLAKWRLHLFVHVFLYCLTPLLVLVLIAPLRSYLSLSLISGFILLAALPCTISTSIVYSVRLGGSLAPAIFNATVANLVGVAITPLVVGLLAPSSGGRGIDVGTALINTASIVFPPILLGQLARQPIREWASAQKSQLNNVTSLLILLIVYVAFAASVRDGLWQRLGPTTLALVALVCVIFFAAQMLLAAASLRRLKFERNDTITAFVCSTQKTLAAGIPLADAIFADTDLDLGVILLPLLIFYAIQLIVGEAVIKSLVPKAAQPFGKNAKPSIR